MSEICFRQVRHSYGDRTVLDGIDLTLTERRVGIVGANGSGKSTLARMINGLVVPSAGAVTVDGFDTAKKGREVRKRVGFVFTDPDHQIVMPTVAEDVAFSLRRSGLGKAERADRVREILGALLDAPYTSRQATYGSVTDGKPLRGRLARELRPSPARLPSVLVL